MKKIIALSLTLALALSLAACGEKPVDSTVDSSASGTNSSAAVSTTYKTGVGAVVKASPVDATADKDGSVQIDTTIVAATFDANGVIVSCTIDTAQQKGTFSAKGEITGKEIDTRTKVEKGADYGMVKFTAESEAPSIAEFDAQVASLAEWMTGKTVAEVKAMKTYDKGDGNHTTVPDEEDLKATVTITVEDYIAALEKAEANAKEATGVPAKTGLGIVVSPATTPATADKDGSIQIDTTFVVAAFDADGKIVSCTIDTAQQKGAFSAEGVAKKEIDLRTKVEKGADYGMVKFTAESEAPSIAEFDAQVASLAEWMTGKTVAEVNAMKTYDKGDGNHTTVPDEEDLKATVTITVEDYQAALTKAEANAK